MPYRDKSSSNLKTVRFYLNFEFRTSCDPRFTFISIKKNYGVEILYLVHQNQLKDITPMTTLTIVSKFLRTKYQNMC